MTKSSEKNSEKTAVSADKDKGEASNSEVIAKPIPEKLPSLGLHEFCSRLSSKDRRVELIGAFEFDERRNSRLKDTAQNYEARFQAFVRKPA